MTSCIAWASLKTGPSKLSAALIFTLNGHELISTGQSRQL